MLKLGPQQRSDLDDVAREESEQRILALLRRHYAPTAVWPDEERALVVVRAAIAKAAGYEMPAERDAFKLASLMLVFGDDFDARETWAQEILAAREGNAPIAELLHCEGVAQIRRREDGAP